MEEGAATQAAAEAPQRSQPQQQPPLSPLPAAPRRLSGGSSSGGGGLGGGIPHVSQRLMMAAAAEAEAEAAAPSTPPAAAPAPPPPPPPPPPLPEPGGGSGSGSGSVSPTTTRGEEEAALAGSASGGGSNSSSGAAQSQIREAAGLTAAPPDSSDSEDMSSSGDGSMSDTDDSEEEEEESGDEEPLARQDTSLPTRGRNSSSSSSSNTNSSNYAAEMARQAASMRPLRGPSPSTADAPAPRSSPTAGSSSRAVAPAAPPAMSLGGRLMWTSEGGVVESHMLPGLQSLTGTGGAGLRQRRPSAGSAAGGGGGSQQQQQWQQRQQQGSTEPRTPMGMAGAALAPPVEEAGKETETWACPVCLQTYDEPFKLQQCTCRVRCVSVPIVPPNFLITLHKPPHPTHTAWIGSAGGHTFCRSCIEGLIRSHTARVAAEAGGGLSSQPTPEHPQCPLCRHAFTQADAQPDGPLLEAMRAVRVRCPNRGCGAIYSPLGTKAHQDACPYAAAPCPHQPYGCSFQAPRKDLRAHVALCPYEHIKGLFPKVRKEGRTEGRKEGRKEGRTEGRKAMVATACHPRAGWLMAPLSEPHPCPHPAAPAEQRPGDGGDARVGERLPLAAADAGVAHGGPPHAGPAEPPQAAAPRRAPLHLLLGALPVA